MNRGIGFIFVSLAGVGFGFLGIFARLAFQSGLSVGELLTFRFTLAALLLWLGLTIFKPTLIPLSFRQIFISICLGVFGYALFSTLYFKALEGISVPLAALLLFTFPIFVNLGAHFILKERMTGREVFSLLLAILGLGVLLWGPLVVNSRTSVLFGLGSAISYSIYVLVSGKLQKNVRPLSSSLYVVTSTAVALYFYHHPSFHRLLELNSQQILIIIGIATVSTILPLTLFLAGLQRLTSSQAAMIVMIEPIVAALAASLLLGEILTKVQLLGAGMVLVALILNSVRRRKSSPSSNF